MEYSAGFPFVPWWRHWYKPCMSHLTIGFLGAGKMATALASGFLKAKLVPASAIHAFDIYEPAREAFVKETGAVTHDSNLSVVHAADVLILAVKPDQIAGVLAEVSSGIGSRHLIISIAAGVTLSRLESCVPAGTRVIRVMPNTPALVGESASAFAHGTYARSDDSEVARKLLGSVGLVLEVKEKLLDAVTGVSGSGPAYAFLMIEALADGGVAAGLPRDVAQKLAAQTLLGAAKMVLETGLHPGALKDAVCSPGGTTIEAIHELEKAGVRGALMTAVRSASDKARKLA